VVVVESTPRGVGFARESQVRDFAQVLHLQQVADFHHVVALPPPPSRRDSRLVPQLTAPEQRVSLTPVTDQV
jgi:hypothetical protein